MVAAAGDSVEEGAGKGEEDVWVRVPAREGQPEYCESPTYASAPTAEHTD